MVIFELEFRHKENDNYGDKLYVLRNIGDENCR